MLSSRTLRLLVLGAANAAMKASGLGTFTITDGWRSYAAQVEAKRKKGRLAATPGRSVHGIGMAADLGLTRRQFEWLKENGARFGLQNLPSESWHWQFSASAPEPPAPRPSTPRQATPTARNLSR